MSNYNNERLIELEAENATLRSRLAEAERDAARIDFLSKRMTGASDSERYLPFRVYWGDSKDARKAIDAAMEGGE